MPTGIKLVIWTPENETKLFHAILAIHDIKVDNAKVAAIFGPNIPASAISSHMSKLRRKATGLVDPGYKSTPVTANVRAEAPARAPTSSKKANGKGRKRGGMLNYDLSGDESMNTLNATDYEDNEADNEADNETTTPAPSAKRQKTIGGRITKARVSPRKISKKNYKALEDPFAAVDATDGEGEKVFGTEKSESEDECATDDDFGVAKKSSAVGETTAIKNEEAV